MHFLSKHSILRVMLLLIGAIIFMNCARDLNPNIQRGSTYKYRSGHPEVRFSGVGFLNEQNQPSIDISADIVYGSLIFKEIDGKQQANITIDVRIINQNNSEDIIASKHYELDIADNENKFINSQESYIFEKQLPVPAGDYKVYFTVTDLNSNNEITRIANTGIPDPEISRIDLTDIRMLGKDIDTEPAKWVPINTYDVPGRVDSLMFILQATNNDSDQPLTIDSELTRFKADDSIARPMFFNDYSRSTIEYTGINYNNDTQVQQGQRKLLQEGSVFIEYRFAQQEQGNYRFSVRTNKEEQELFKGRDFGVRSEHYPAVKSAKELARPLIYLMGEGEYEELMEMEDPDKIKAQIDRFWLKNVGDRNQTKAVIEMYYNRVEQANKQFSSFKEGWKTDPGLVYILFGPPVYANRQAETMIWAYSNNLVSSDYNFRFVRPRVNSEFFPFTHYVLNRSQRLYDVQYQQKELWLSGMILQRRR